MVCILSHFCFATTDICKAYAKNTENEPTIQIFLFLLISMYTTIMKNYFIIEVKDSAVSGLKYFLFEKKICHTPDLAFNLRGENQKGQFIRDLTRIVHEGLKRGSADGRGRAASLTGLRPRARRRRAFQHC
jgi:hypothetical protein